MAPNRDKLRSELVFYPAAGVTGELYTFNGGKSSQDPDFWMDQADKFYAHIRAGSCQQFLEFLEGFITKGNKGDISKYAQEVEDELNRKAFG